MNLSLKIQGALQHHENNLAIIHSFPQTGELANAASSALADRVVTEVIHPLIVADAIQQLLEKSSNGPKSNYLNGFQHRLECHIFQSMRKLGVVGNEL